MKSCSCNERIEAVAEPAPIPATTQCLPWVKVTRDPERFSACLARARELGRMDDSDAVYKLLREPMLAEDQEVFYVILLDIQMMIRGVAEIARAERDSVVVPIPDILRVILIEGATNFIVAHNHPSGDPRPSNADKSLTKDIQRAADQFPGITFVDHLVVGERKYYSFAEHGLLLKKDKKK